jgi:uridine kinase
MQDRQIPRNPKAPPLTKELIDLLTELCFRPDDVLKPVDLIFVFGASTDYKKLAEITRLLLDKNIAQKVFVSGGGSKYSDTLKILDRPESWYILQEINPSNYPNVQFFSETISTNCRENVTEALKILDFSSYKSILFVSKGHDCKRCYLTLQKFAPNAKLLQRTFYGKYHDTQELTKEGWSKPEFGRTRVWGEFLRIKTYGERGDIAYDPETKILVDKITKLSKTISLENLVLTIQDKAKHKSPFIIALSGFGGAGKSTTANKLASYLEFTDIISIDDFILDRLSNRSDDWRGFDWERLTEEVLQPLRSNNKTITYGVYNWKENKIVQNKTLRVSQYVIIEGVGLLRPELQSYFDLSIWIDAPLEIASEQGKKRDREEYKANHDQLWDTLWIPNDNDYYKKYHPEQITDFLLETRGDNF